MLYIYNVIIILHFLVWRIHGFKNKDLKIKSPYNTYLHKGLPPGPISNPGLSALIAAINPEKSNYLYFVSDAEGGHIFSKTVREHKDAVKIFQRKRRQKNHK